MTDNENMMLDDYDSPYEVTLVDDETGEEIKFVITARAEIEGKMYFALENPDEESDEFIILRAKIEGEEVLFEDIEDDDEFYKVEDYFNDLFFGEVNYDGN